MFLVKNVLKDRKPAFIDLILACAVKYNIQTNWQHALRGRLGVLQLEKNAFVLKQRLVANLCHFLNGYEPRQEHVKTLCSLHTGPLCFHARLTSLHAGPNVCLPSRYSFTYRAAVYFTIGTKQLKEALSEITESTLDKDFLVKNPRERSLQSSSFFLFTFKYLRLMYILLPSVYPFIFYFQLA